jgi:nicotinamide riboside transporter PnuC
VNLVQTFSWIFVVIAIIGGIFNARKNIVGFYIWLFSNTGLAILNFVAGMPAQGILFIVFTITTIYGIHEWRKRK